ncbi:hypothetical protein XENOCAPTIV_004356, partial [Xenoophorus captivus]
SSGKMGLTRGSTGCNLVHQMVCCMEPSGKSFCGKQFQQKKNRHFQKDASSTNA